MALRIVVRLDAIQSRVLVTGGAGFIGSHLVDRLVDIGHDVIVLDKFSTGRTKNLSRSLAHQNLNVMKGDIRKISQSFVKRLRRVDVVCHLAAVTSVQQSVRDPVFTTEANLVGTLNVLQAAKALMTTPRYAHLATEAKRTTEEEIRAVHGPGAGSSAGIDQVRTI